MKGIIYCYTSPNGKCYVGQTVEEKRRMYQHKCDSVCKGRNWDKPFYRAIRKYGWNSFSYEILWEKESDDLELLRKLLNKQEIFYISVFDSYRYGYNSTKGGTPEKINFNRGHRLSEEHIKKLKNSVSKCVWQFDLNGNFIKEYPSAAEAARFLNANCSSQIISCCRGKSHTSLGFQWKYKGVFADKYHKPIIKRVGRYGKDNFRSKSVLQLDLNKNIIREWDCLMDITRFYGYNSGSICHAIQKKQKYKNFYWTYKQ